ncbi:trypsin-like peptidase domain-containing protein [Aerosakkonemataceae cyanobacterium BLCC-F154]|uniref:Trypsin-like peptidase domain-containing protein n=1 Tax=Floridaenema fluviatile BLCC-F154 TaxID=3153640 RepID=A0ABV4Y7Z9_9CYAN
MATNNYFQAFKGAIARIYHANGNVVGAGFLVSDRHLLTCAHVVTAALAILPQNAQDMPVGSVELDFPLIAPGQKLKSKVVFWLPVNPSQTQEDIAGLELESTPPVTIEPVRLLAAEDYWEHNCRIFGFPQGHDLGIWATGILRDKRANDWLQIDALAAQNRAVEKGFSGAPIWDESLQGVVGMAVAAEKRREDVTAAFMIPTSILRSAWSDLGQWMDRYSLSLRNFSDNLPSFRQVKLKALNGRYSVLCAQYEATYNQLNYTLSQADIVSIREQIKELEKEIINVEQEINNLSK